MKKLIIAFAFFIIGLFSVSSQDLVEYPIEVSSIKKDTVVVNRQFIPMMDEFMAAARKESVDLRNFENLFSVIVIDFDNLPGRETDLGLTIVHNGEYFVFISDKLKLMSSYKIVLFHELMHVLMFEIMQHCDTEPNCPELAKSGKIIDTSRILGNWNISKTNLMRYIRKKQLYGK